MSVSLNARNKKSSKKADLKIQASEWMARISSNPEMRKEMIEMILDETKGNKEEMTNFVRTLMDNPEMNSIISGLIQLKIINDNISIRPLVMTGDSIETMTSSAYKLSKRK
jgi:hypothetical protein